MSSSIKQSRNILSEEDYISTLASIVQRDYFPDLPSLQKQAAVLDRREANDFRGAVAVRRAARRVQDHEDALAEEERKLEEDLVGDVRTTKRPLHRETVSGFHARVTSEDNHEYHQKSQQELRDKRSRIEAVYRNPHPALTSGERNGNETPLLASDQFNAPWHRITAPKNPEQDNGFFFPPRLCSKPEENLLLLTNESEENLMPPPARLLPKQALVEYIPKQMLEKRIEPARTRFQTSTAIAPPRSLSPTDETDYSTETSTDLDCPGAPLAHERSAGAKRKARELETLVAMTPLIAPQASPLTTWGTINNTPLVLTKAFSMPEKTSREIAARMAEEKIASRRTSSKGTTTPLNRLSSLTPAARSLLQKSMPPKSSARSSNAFSNALQKSYTPVSQRNRDVALGQETPRLNVGRSKQRSSKQVTSSKSLTDGLLNLPI